MNQDVQIREMRARLRRLHAEDSEECVTTVILRFIEDPLRVAEKPERVRINQLLVLLAALAAIAAGAFAYFSMG